MAEEVSREHSPLSCPFRHRSAPADKPGASWTRCELLAWLARSSARSGGGKVAPMSPSLCHGGHVRAVLADTAVLDLPVLC